MSGATASPALSLQYLRVCKLIIGKPGTPAQSSQSAVSLDIGGQDKTMQVGPNNTVTLSASDFQQLNFNSVGGAQGAGAEGTLSADNATFNADGTVLKVTPTTTPGATVQPGQALDLSAFRIVFTVTKSSVSSPNVAVIRVYNLSRQTASLIQKEFTAVSLTAGYAFNAAEIFNGTVIRMTRGKNMDKQAEQAQPSILVMRENQTDTYLEIVATEGDIAHNFTTVHVTLAAGATIDQQVAAINSAISAQGYKITPPATYPQGSDPLPRGQVYHGQLRDIMDTFCAGIGCTWSIQGNALEIIPKDAVLAGQAIVLSSDTGLVGYPRETINGVEMTALLNPALKPGRVVQLKAPINQQQPPTGYSDLDIVNPLDPLGYYRVFYFQHTGDTRGNPWYTNIIGLAMTSAGPNPGASSIQYYGT